MDAMVEPWHDEVCVCLTLTPLPPRVIAGLDPAIHADRPPRGRPVELQRHGMDAVVGPLHDEVCVCLTLPTLPPAVIAGPDPAIHADWPPHGRPVEQHRLGMDAVVGPLHDEVCVCLTLTPLPPAVIAGLDPAIHAYWSPCGKPVEQHRLGMDAVVGPLHDERGVDFSHNHLFLRQSLQGLTLQSMPIGLRAGGLSSSTGTARRAGMPLQGLGRLGRARFLQSILE